MNGTDTLTYLTASVRTVEKPNLTNTTIVAQPPPAFGAVSGKGGPLGTFQIANLPTCGDYYLAGFSEPGIQPGPYSIFLLTNSLTPDMSRSVTGRHDAVAITMATAVTVSLTGLDSWVAAGSAYPSGDALVLTSPGAGVASLDLAKAASINIPVGATTYAETFDASQHFVEPNLIDGTKGDHVFALQYETAVQQPSGLACQTVAKSASLGNITMTDGQPVTITAALTAPTAIKTLSVNWAATQFAALASKVGANAKLGGNFVTVTGHMGAPSDGDTVVAPALLTLSPPTGADVNLQATFADPFNGALTFYAVEAYTNYSVMVSAPGATATAFFVGIGYLADQPTFQAQNPVVPLITPVTNIKVDGNDGFGTGTTSTNPVIAFSAPATGTAARYVIRIYQLTKGAGGGTIVTEVGEVHGARTSFIIPSGIVSSGSTYAYMIMAQTYPGATVNPDATPRRAPYPNAYAQALAGPFTAN